MAAFLFFFRTEPAPSSKLKAVGETRPRRSREALFASTPQGTGGQSIGGHVYDADGPIVGAKLVAVRVDQEEDLSVSPCSGECTFFTAECETAQAAAQVVDWVKGRRGEAPPVAQTTSAEDGTYVLTGLEPGIHRVWASTERHIAIAKNAQSGAQEVDVFFESDAAVSGRVVGLTEGSLAGTWVTAFLPDAPRYFDVQTTEDGSFDFGSLPSSALSIVALGADGSSAHLHLQSDIRVTSSQSHRNRLELVLTAPTKQLVRVLAQGKPASGAAITVMEGGHHRAWTASDAGEATLELPARSPALLIVSLGDFGSQVVVEAMELGVKPVVVELQPAGWLTGLVRDDLNQPVAHAQVKGDRAVAVTDGTGRYRLGPLFTTSAGSQGTRKPIEASGTGFAPTIEEAVDFEIGQVKERDFVLRKEAPFRGRVVTPEGTPLASVRVTASPSSSEVKTTGPDGIFAFANLAPGPYTVFATHPLWGVTERIVSAPNAAIELAFEAGGELDVICTDERDRPAQVQVTVESNEFMGPGRPLMDRRYANTDRLGRVSFKGLRAGRYLLIADTEGDFRAQLTTEIKEKERREHHLVISEGLHSEGVVVDTGGLPLADVNVDAKPLNQATSPMGMRPSELFAAISQQKHASTNDQGRFQLRHLREGTYRVTARGLSGTTEANVVAGSSGLKLILPAQDFAVGRVVDSQGRPLNQFHVNGKEVDTSTGSFRVPLIGGQIRLVIQAEGYPLRELEYPGHAVGGVYDFGTVALKPARSVQMRLVDAKSSKPVQGIIETMSDGRTELLTDPNRMATVPGFSSDQDGFVIAQAEGYVKKEAVVAAGIDELVIALEAGARLTGHIVLADGQPATSATLTLRKPEMNTARPPSAFTDEKGLYRLTAPEGSWEVEVELGPGHLEALPEKVTLVAGQETRLDVTEPSGGVTLSVRFVDARGEPLLISGVLVPGIVACPETLEGYRALKKAHRVLPHGRPSAAMPGEFTLVALSLSMGEDLHAFTERVTVTSAPQQQLTVRVPATLQKLTRRSR